LGGNSSTAADTVMTSRDGAVVATSGYSRTINDLMVLPFVPTGYSEITHFVLHVERASGVTSAVGFNVLWWEWYNITSMDWTLADGFVLQIRPNAVSLVRADGSPSPWTLVEESGEERRRKLKGVQTNPMAALVGGATSHHPVPKPSGHTPGVCNECVNSGHDLNLLSCNSFISMCEQSHSWIVCCEMSRFPSRRYEACKLTGHCPSDQSYDQWCNEWNWFHSCSDAQDCPDCIL
jgi:hypothetical protein